MTDQIVPDSEHRGLVARLPQGPRDLAMLARFDRPIGWWLLFWPCVWGVWLAGAGWQVALLGWLLLGAGVNLNNKLKLETAVSVRDILGRRVSREEFLKEFFRFFWLRYSSWEYSSLSKS